MALSDDQKAMLRLLAQREEGYEDMAALMGLSVEEVRAKVKEALAEVEDGPAEVQAPAPSDAPAAPPPPPPLPPTPPVAAPTPAAPSRRPRPPRPTFKLKLPKPRKPGGGKGPQRADNRGALIGIGAGIAALVILVVILLVGGSGGGGSSSPTADATEGRSGEIAAVESGQLTQAILSPTSGGNGSGRALFGRFKKNVLLQVEAEGLDPSPAGQAYTIWLYRSPKLVLRIGAVPVGKNGKIAAQFPIPTQLLAYVANGAFDQIDVSLTSEAAYKADLAKAKGEKRLPGYTGESVLRGQITGPAIKSSGGE